MGPLYARDTAWGLRLAVGEARKSPENPTVRPCLGGNPGVDGGRTVKMEALTN